MVDRDQPEVIRLLGDAPTQNVGHITVSVQEADVKDSDLVDLVNRDLGGGNIVHGAFSVDILLERSHLLDQLLGGAHGAAAC
jgi:lipoate-protein ligase A